MDSDSVDSDTVDMTKPDKIDSVRTVAEILSVGTKASNTTGTLFRLKTQVRSATQQSANCTAYTLKDDGATNDFISRAFAMKHKFPIVHTGRRAIILSASDCEERTVEKELEQVQLTMDITDCNGKIFRIFRTYTVMELGT